MNARLTYIAATVCCLALALGTMWLAAPTPAHAEKDICATAVSKMYDRCGLQFRITDNTLTENQAVNYCREQTGSLLNACWLGCTSATNDCGEIANCVDGCFDGALECGFTADLVYDGCDGEVTGAETEEPLTKSEAITECSDLGGDLYKCYANCAFDNSADCDEMGDCLTLCADPDADVDDDTADDTDDDTASDDDDDGPTEAIEDADGDSLENVHGSTCGA